MEYTNRKMAMGAPPCPKTPRIGVKPFPVMSSSAIPLATGSVDVTKKAYFNGGASEGGGARVAPPTNGGTSVKLEEEIDYELKHGCCIDPNMDPKKLKRTILNRLSAQRARMKKALYINDMENRVKHLEAHIAVISSQIAYSKHHVEMLSLERSILKQKLGHVTHKSNLLQIQIQEKKVEVEKLRELQMIQKEKEKTSALNSGLGQVASFSIHESKQPASDRNASKPGEVDQYVNFNEWN